MNNLPFEYILKFIENRRKLVDEYHEDIDYKTAQQLIGYLQALDDLKELIDTFGMTQDEIIERTKQKYPEAFKEKSK